MIVLLSTIKKLINFLSVKSKVMVYSFSKKPLRVVLGAGGNFQKGWIPTDIEILDILNKKTWDKLFRINAIDVLLAEHVWEHLTLAEAVDAARNCYEYLKFGGYIRVAVPDGFHPSPEYIEWVRPGGIGAGSDDHKVLYNYKTLLSVFESVNFQVELVEYFDETGQFQSKEWRPDTGLITRSAKYDPRNENGQLKYTSIIMDAWKK